jgi:predicted Zn-dependent protease
MGMDTERLKEIAERTVAYAVKEKVDQAQASAFMSDTALTRFANSQIHQNVAQKSGGVTIKVILKKKISKISIGTLEGREIEKAVIQAIKIARASSPSKEFRSLPEPRKWAPIAGAYDKKTAECDPKIRAEKVKEAIDTAHAKSPKVKTVAGFLSSGSMGFAVANSLGVSAWAALSTTSMKTTVISRSGDSEGFAAAEKHSRKIKDISPRILARDAADKSIKSLNPVKVEPREYEVVLSPVAVSTLMMYLGFVGFSADAYQDGQSFVKYSLNKQVFDGKLNIVDDARDPKTFYSLPVDGEGVPKKTMKLVNRGIVSERSICHNSFTAGKEGKKSTGHAPAAFGGYYGIEEPGPMNMVVKAGDSTIEEAIAETKHGIFVNTVHYVNPAEPTKVVLTGLTRDGTFLIENGAISKPIVNMRFTDSMLSAFKDIPMIGKHVETLRMTAVPMLKLKKLRFVGLSAY